MIALALTTDEATAYGLALWICSGGFAFLALVARVLRGPRNP